MNNQQSSNNVEIYTKSYCPFCHRAKALLDAKGIAYQEYEITDNRKLEQEMRERSGRSSVPQVFINQHHVGGSDDLADAQANGTLDALLGQRDASAAIV